METNLVVILIGTSGMLLMVISMFAFAYLYQRKMNRKQTEMSNVENLLRKEELKSAYSLIEGQDRERERIAQDLHDQIGGQLSTVKIYLDLLNKIDGTSEQKKLIGKLHNATDNTIQAVRSVAHDLSNSTLIYYGLPKALEQLCETINDSKKITAKTFCSINTEIPPELARDVYQIIQELITNTLKHAEASSIRVELTSINDELNIIYEDNGKGFDSTKKVKGIGLRGINTRSEKYNGTVKIDSKKNQGTTFILEIPISND